jgi:hypothetical protein
MKPVRRLFVILLLVSLSAACASTGTGDPAVVKAEDALSNGLTVYATAMDFHFKNSTTESPAIYKAFESFRVNFPIAWTALDNAKREYQRNRALGTASLDAKLSALSTLIAGITPLITGGR